MDSILNTVEPKLLLLHGQKRVGSKKYGRKKVAGEVPSEQELQTAFEQILQ